MANVFDILEVDNNLYTTIELSFVEAMCGFVRVLEGPWWDTPLKFTSPEGIVFLPEDISVVYGEGVFDEFTQQQGNLYIRWNVAYPLFPVGNAIEFRKAMNFVDSAIPTNVLQKELMTIEEYMDELQREEELIRQNPPQYLQCGVSRHVEYMEYMELEN